MKRRESKSIAELDRLATTVADAKANAARLEAEAEAAALRSAELAQLDADELLGEITPDVAAKKRIEIKGAIEQKANEAARARALLVPLQRHLVGAVNEVAAGIVSQARPDYDKAVDDRTIAAAELAKADLQVEAADARLDEATSEAEQVRIRFDATAKERHDDRERADRERIRWFLTQGSELALRQLPTHIHDRARAAWAERVIEQRDRFADVRDRAPGEVFSGESYPRIEIRL